MILLLMLMRDGTTMIRRIACSVFSFSVFIVGDLTEMVVGLRVVMIICEQRLADDF